MNRRMTNVPMIIWAALLLLSSTAMAQRSHQKRESQSSPQMQSQRQQQMKQQKQVSGTVVHSKNVQIRRQGRDTGQQNRVILLQTQDGQRLVVDLGPEQYLQHVKLLPGTDLQAQGRVVRIGDRPVLFAQQIETQGQTLRVQRPLREPRQQARQLSGQIERMKEVRFRGTQQTNQVVLLQTSQGRQVIVDLGPAQQLQQANLQQGMQIDVQGDPVRIGDRLVLLANQVTTNGQTFQIEHAKPSQSQSAWQQERQQQQQTARQGVHPQGISKIHIASASDIAGRTVHDRQGQDAGTVQYLMIDVQNGDVRYAMIGADGNLDIGEDLIAVPWSAIEMQKQALKLNKSLDQLKQAPRFSEQRLSDLTQPAVASLVYNYYLVPEGQAQQGRQGQQQMQGDQGRQAQQDAQGQQQMQGDQGRQAQQGAQGQQQTQTGQPHILVGRDILTMLVPPAYMSSSEVRGTEVASATGEIVGSIDQVMIDTDHGHIAYVLLLQEGFLGIDDQWIPVPYETLQWSTADQSFALSIAEDQLQPMAKLPRQNLPTDVRAAKLQQFYEQYGVTPYWERMAQTQAASASIRATVQEVNDQQSTVTLQMSKGKTVEMEVSEEMITNLEAGDSVEVVIRPSDETPFSGQTRGQQSPSEQSR